MLCCPTIMTSQLLNTKQLAEWANVSPRTVQSWIAGRTVPYLKIGGAVRFRLEDVEKALQAYRRPAVSELTNH
jgi:excisionase family DNA binding protein